MTTKVLADNPTFMRFRKLDGRVESSIYPPNRWNLSKETTD